MTAGVLYAETFDTPTADGALPAGWWAEGGERVWVEDGRLWVRANPPVKGDPGGVCTVWCPTPFEGDVVVEVDACCTASTIDANNINLFVHYGMPEGGSLSETRYGRRSGEYALYHRLDGYIATFLNDWNGEHPPHPDGTPRARARLRRCPGFELLVETFAHHCRRDVVYRLAVAVQGRRLRLSVDGQVLVQAHVDQPWDRGLVGLRTFQTELWWDNLRVRRP